MVTWFACDLLINKTINTPNFFRVSLHRARELIEEFEIESSVGLTKLLSDNPIDLPGKISWM